MAKIFINGEMGCCTFAAISHLTTAFTYDVGELTAEDTDGEPSDPISKGKSERIDQNEIWITSGYRFSVVPRQIDEFINLAHSGKDRRHE